MNYREGISQLIFTPNDPEYTPVNSIKIIQALIEIKLLGEPLTDTTYHVGEEFLNLLSFLGCSPNIALEPRDDLAFCHFEFPQAEPEKVLIASKTLKPPLCPSCRSSLPEWLKEGVIDTEITCSSCQQPQMLSDLIWRRKAMSFSRWHIALWNIFESEAVPSPVLMDTLQIATGVAWDYRYITR